MSPEAFAVAAVWWMIARRRDPFAYLGALYLFEGLTPTVTGMVKEKLRAKGFTEKSLEYVEFHSTEDVKHANLVHYLISEVASTYPEATESIKYGFECFRAVCPIPLWRAAFDRAFRVGEGK
jgi:pyrroloquinoline quinone (PQQ) biosynthesis protein C